MTSTSIWVNVIFSPITTNLYNLNFDICGPHRVFKFFGVIKGNLNFNIKKNWKISIFYFKARGTQRKGKLWDGNAQFFI